MRIAYFDTISGISGDMALGAFIDAGVSIDTLSSEIMKLNLNDVELQATHVERGGIRAVKLDVVVTDVSRKGRHLADIIRLIDESSLGNRVKENAKKCL